SEKVEYVLVGGYAVILHGYPRTTGDMDVWVNPTKENYKRILKSFSNFGMSIFDMTEENFLNTKKYDVFKFGTSPVRIDLMTEVKGLNFEETFEQAIWIDIDEKVKAKTIHINQLIQTKKASNRPKDIDDLNNLKES
ncbi:MAG: nucleotidyltransferase, partial [Candidatus Paceibacterales bacterium]